MLRHRRPPALQLLDGPYGRPTALLQVVAVHHHAGRVPQVVVQRGKDLQRGCRGGPLQGCGKMGVCIQPISHQRRDGGLVVVGSMPLALRQLLAPPTSVGRGGWPQGPVPLHPAALAPVQIASKGFLIQQVLQHGPLKRLEPLGRIELAKGQNHILLRKPKWHRLQGVTAAERSHDSRCPEHRAPGLPMPPPSDSGQAGLGIRMGRIKDHPSQRICLTDASQTPSGPQSHASRLPCSAGSSACKLARTKST